MGVDVCTALHLADFWVVAIAVHAIALVFVAITAMNAKFRMHLHTFLKEPSCIPILHHILEYISHREAGEAIALLDNTLDARPLRPVL